MGFPIFDMPFAGNPILIAVDAIVHVLLSHGIAIGAASFIVLAEWWGLRHGAPEWERFARRLVKPTTIAVVAVGAPTGVGIWLITSVIAPRGIGSLLRVFFWPWFVEWLVFTGEVILLLVYLFTWDRMTGDRKRRHVVIGLVYVGFSAATAVLITGILGFMLTPDGWPWVPRLRNAFLNPSYPPQLLLRLGTAVLLGSLYTSLWLALAPGEEPAFRARALRIVGRVAAGALLVVAVAGVWYASAIPAAAKPFFASSWGMRGFSQAPRLLWIVNGALALVVAGFVVAALLGRTRRMGVLAGAAALAAIAVVAQFEFVRESLRKPWLMPGFLYVNQIEAREVPVLRAEGLLRSSYWYAATVQGRSPAQEGAYLFLQSCSRCHSVGGFNDIRAAVAGRPEDAIRVLLGASSEVVPFMPPFAGTDDERRILASFLRQVGDGTIPADAVRHYSVRGGKGLAP